MTWTRSRLQRLLSARNKQVSVSLEVCVVRGASPGIAQTVAGVAGLLTPAPPIAMLRFAADLQDQNQKAAAADKERTEQRNAGM